MIYLNLLGKRVGEGESEVGVGGGERGGGGVGSGTRKIRGVLKPSRRPKQKLLFRL